MQKNIFTIRKGMEKDLEDFFELFWISSLEHMQYNEELDALKPKEQCKEFVINRQREYLKDKNQFFLIAETENKIIGMLTGHIEKRDEHELYLIETVGFIDEICIIPEHRKIGVGKKLIEHVLEEMFRRDVEFVGLSAAYKNVAIDFYKLCGFTLESVWMIIRKPHDKKNLI